MKAYSIQELHRQTAALANDLPSLLAGATADARSALPVDVGGRIVVLGSGDSLNAAIACRDAFAADGTLDYRAMTGTEFVHYPPSPRRAPDEVTVVGVSASGNNPSLVTAVRRARTERCRTIAVTASLVSPLAAAAEHTVAVPTVGSSQPSPGIRTYQASLIGLLALAQRAMRAETIQAVETTGFVAHSVEIALEPVANLVPRFATAPVVVVVGTGPTLGTARHVAAKVTETAGCPAIGVELEDWWHVHRFGHPLDLPVIVFATHSAGRDAALSMARRTQERRPVVVVAPEDDEEAAGIGDTFIPVAGGVSAAMQPLTNHVFAGPFAAGLAQARNALPFANS